MQAVLIHLELSEEQERERKDETEKENSLEDQCNSTWWSSFTLSSASGEDLHFVFQRKPSI
jgi:hypothetical protein